MNFEDLSHILSTEPDIVPSSGFTKAVIDAVLDEARMPKPIPFPWIRVIPAAFACCLTVYFLAMKLLPAEPAAWELHVRAIITFWRAGLNWLTLALSISTFAILITRRLLSE